jgi:hypothetical protein
MSARLVRRPACVVMPAVVPDGRRLMPGVDAAAVGLVPGAGGGVLGLAPCSGRGALGSMPRLRRSVLGDASCPGRRVPRLGSSVLSGLTGCSARRCGHRR